MPAAGRPLKIAESSTWATRSAAATTGRRSGSGAPRDRIQLHDRQANRHAQLHQRLRLPDADVNAAIGLLFDERQAAGVDRRQLPAVGPAEIHDPPARQVQLQHARCLGVDGGERRRQDGRELALQQIQRHHGPRRLRIPSEPSLPLAAAADGSPFSAASAASSISMMSASLNR